MWKRVCLSLRRAGLAARSEVPRIGQTRHASTDRLEPADAPSMLDIGIRRIFSEEHDIFRRSARRFFQEEVLPKQREWEKNGIVDREIWLKAGEQGYLGLAVPTELGGGGGDFLYESIIVDEQSYVNDQNLMMGMHSVVCMPYILKEGTPEQINKYIPGCISGEIITALAMTEPNAGTDLQGIRTHVKRDGDDWILNGSKTFITNGYLSDLVIVVAVTNPEAKSPAHGLGLFLVEAGLKGFTKGKPLAKMGNHGNDTCELFFDDVRLPNDALLGASNQGFYYLMQQLPRERLGISMVGIAHAEWMLEETRAYVKQRKAFGKTISALQTVQHTLAEMKTEICVSRAFVDQCIMQYMEGSLTAQTASMAKWWVTDLQKRVADQCVQLHGGWGYMLEMPIARAFTTARVQSIYGGSNEIMKELIGREIVAKS